MLAAIAAAKKSGFNGDYAVGAVVVKNNRIISVGYETLKSANDPVNGHAEIDAIRKACKKLKQPYLEGCVLYSTHEPCPMCASAIIWAKIDTVVFGATQEDNMRQTMKQGLKKFTGRTIKIKCGFVFSKGIPKVKIVPKFMRKECLKLFNLLR